MAQFLFTVLLFLVTLKAYQTQMSTAEGNLSENDVNVGMEYSANAVSESEVVSSENGTSSNQTSANEQLFIEGDGNETEIQAQDAGPPGLEADETNIVEASDTTESSTAEDASAEMGESSIEQGVTPNESTVEKDPMSTATDETPEIKVSSTREDAASALNESSLVENPTSAVVEASTASSDKESVTVEETGNETGNTEDNFSQQTEEESTSFPDPGSAADAMIQQEGEHVSSIIPYKQENALRWFLISRIGLYSISCF